METYKKPLKVIRNRHEITTPTKDGLVTYKNDSYRVNLPNEYIRQLPENIRENDIYLQIVFDPAKMQFILTVIPNNQDPKF